MRGPVAGSTTTIPGPGDDRPEEDALWLCLYGYEVSTSVKATRRFEAARYRALTLAGALLPFSTF